MDFQLDVLYELVEEGRGDEVCDFILDIYYLDENPMDSIVRIARESNLAAGEIIPAPETQVERIDSFITELDFDRLDLEGMVSIMSYSHPYKKRMKTYQSTLEYYNKRFEKILEDRPGLKF